MSVPRRFKDPAEMSVAEHAARQGRTDGGLAETEEYRAARREALEAAGLEIDDDLERELEDMTVQDHLKRKGYTR